MMFERFTASARAAVIGAQHEARALNHPQIGPEHVVLGMLAASEGLGAAILTDAGLTPASLRAAIAARGVTGPDAEVLRTLGIDLDEVRRRAEETFGPGALERRRGKPQGHLAFTREAKSALELTLREALRLHHRSIGTEHLLLGILRRDTRLATPLLHDAGVHHAAVEARIAAQAQSG